MSISNFYKDQEIFITGGSGFIGKALIEKLVRSFANCRRIYLLMRSKKGQNGEERLQKLLQNPIFKRAHREQAETFRKIVVIEGNCMDIGLGISEQDLQKLQNVNIIFHSAASVRFDDDLKDAVLLNTRGTHELCKIAEKLKYLKAFIHVSTTFIQPDKKVIEEKFYPSIADWRTTIAIAENYDAETLNIFFPKYSSYQPNTYTFTKCLAEQVINEFKCRLPIMIYRPSIVICSVAEPVPGWLDNFNGPIGMLVACGVGVMRTNLADPDVVLDFIPVDVTVQGLILAAYKVGKRTKPCNAVEEPLEVVNCSNANLRPVAIGQVIEYGKQIVRENPFEKCLWLPEGSITRCAVWHYMRFLTVQIGLTLIVDGLLVLAKRKPLLLKLQRRIYTANKALYRFMCTEWDFKNEKFMSFRDLIPAEDLYKMGIFQYEDIDTETVFINSVKGAKEFLLNEPPEASRNARIRMKIFVILHNSILTIGGLLLARCLIHRLYDYYVNNSY